MKELSLHDLRLQFGARDQELAHVAKIFGIPAAEIHSDHWLLPEDGAARALLEARRRERERRQRRRVSVPQRLLVRFQEGSTDAATVSFSSEAPVTRWKEGKPFIEVLNHDPAAVDLSRLNGPHAPLLWSHDKDQPMGTISRAWLQGQEGWADVKFSVITQDPASIAGQRKAQFLAGELGVSVGYSITQYEQPRPDVLIASRWTPYEISIVAMPADPGCGLQ